MSLCFISIKGACIFVHDLKKEEHINLASFPK